MRVFSRFAAFLLLACVFVLVSIQAETNGSLFKKGQRAEEQEDYDTAYKAFAELYNRKPTDLRYRVAYLRTRTEASSWHVKRGQELRQQGKLQEAIAQFQVAEQIDPANFIADQELRQIQDILRGGVKKPTSGEPPPEGPIQRRLEEAQGPVELAPISNDSITLRLNADSKTAYTTIGKLAGINVIFDPDYPAKQITLDLNKVSLNDALAILATLSNTFWRPVTPNTIFVAANTQNKRRDLEQNVVKTFFLSNLSQPTELQDVVNALRNVLELRFVFPIASQGTIVVRGTPDQLAVAEKLIDDIDKAKPEVLIDVKVMSVSREKVRDLGLQPPTSFSTQLQGSTTSTSTSTSSTSSTTGTTTPTNNLTLNDLGNLNATNFAVTVPAATLNVNFSDSDTKLLQNPQIRASDGQRAQLKIGSRIPIATGSFGGAGVGGAGFGGLVSNTQFQYIDVGVNIDITPKIHADDDISMKVVLDISSQSGQVSIGGITQPVIAQNKVEHEVRVKEGEVTVLGGFLEEQDIKSISGLPGLSQVPILKYLFSSTHTDKLDSELVFVLTPHVVRDLELTEENLKALDIGTGTAIELRRAPQPAPAPAPSSSSKTPSSPQPASAPIVAKALPTAVAAGGQPVAPQGAPANAAVENKPATVSQRIPLPGTPASPAPQQKSEISPVPGEPSLKIDPPATTTAVGQTFPININMQNGQDVYSVPMQISYDPAAISILDVSNGDFLSRDGQIAALVHRDDGQGNLIVSATRPPGVPGISGSGVVLGLTVQAKKKGDTVIVITRPGARNSAQQPISVMGSQAMISVQ